MKQRKITAVTLSLLLLLACVAASRPPINSFSSVQHAIAETDSIAEENSVEKNTGEPLLPGDPMDPDGQGKTPPEGEEEPQPTPNPADDEGEEKEDEGKEENQQDEGDGKEGDDEDPPPLLTGAANLGAFPPVSIEQAGLMTLALPIVYVHEGRPLVSNADAQGNELPYDPQRNPLMYDQAIAQVLSWFSLSPSWVQDADLPFELSSLPQRCELIQNGVNQGFLLLSDIPVQENAEPGEYTLYLEAEWLAIDSDESAQGSFAVTLTVEPGDEEPEEPPEPVLADNCLCCIHCVKCYEEEKLVVASCKCIDEEGKYWGCSCDCPFPKTNAEDMEPNGEPPSGGGEDGSIPEGSPTEDDQTDSGDDGGEAVEELIDCGCDCHEIQSRARPYGNGVIVYSYVELRDAIENGTSSLIYLGFDEINQGTIRNTTSTGIAVRRSVSIIGIDPDKDKQMTLIDSNTVSTKSSFYADADNVTLTFAGLIYIGNNSNGMLYCNDNRTATLKLFDVNYTGRQPIYMLGANKSARVQDCVFTLTNANCFAQIPNIDLAGNVLIDRSGASTVFSMPSGNSSITVETGADVTITMGGVVFSGASSTTLNVLGSLTYSSSSNSTSFISPQLGSIIVSGSLIYTGTNNTSYHITCGTLTVNPGATMAVIGSAACVGVRTSITVNNPACFLLMNDRANGKLQGTANYSLTGNAINLIMASGPRSVWNNNDMSTFTISGRLDYGGNHYPQSTLVGNRGASRYGPVISDSTFKVQRDEPRALIVTTFPDMRINPVLAGATKVTGNAPGTVTVEEVTVVKNDPTDKVVQSASGLSGGSFSTPESWKPISDNTRVYALSSIPLYGDVNVEAHIYYEPREELVLYSVPDTLVFETPGVRGSDQIIDRKITDWTIEVLDTRTTGNPWELTASIAEPLHTADGANTLPGGLIFIEDDDDTFYQFLPGISVPIDSRPPDPQNPFNTIQWPKEKGMHVYVPAFEGVPGESYSTVITWTLTDGV